MVNSDMRQAAHRHYVDGKKLLDSSCYDNAGYHFGFSAECATKVCLLNSGVRDDAAIYVHFQTLKKVALISLNRRTNTNLYKILSRESFMQKWDVNMRYSKNGTISKERAQKWQRDADEVLGLLV